MAQPVIGTPWQKLDHAVPAEELEGVEKYWRAANYLSVGQIYLRSNPLMKKDFVDEKTGGPATSAAPTSSTASSATGAPPRA